ncbi:unnamed protein product [Arctia plantaginis]|uniref:Uncharacterized protein n=1 Tax=Arctia plantaginis TaxID=874455 RepID=A0A8S0YS05_ARCPL|nr:unnamed protein product [Arctia plantaginis]CAB3258632.1 unnamed protein product [Arctia plantaginis]
MMTEDDNIYASKKKKEGNQSGDKNQHENEEQNTGLRTNTKKKRPGYVKEQEQTKSTTGAYKDSDVI